MQADIQGSSVCTAGASALATNLNWGSNERGSPAPLAAGEGRDLWGAKSETLGEGGLEVAKAAAAAVVNNDADHERSFDARKSSGGGGAGRTDGRRGGDNLNLNCRGVFGAMIPSEMRQYEVKKLWAHFCAPQNRTRSLSAGAPSLRGRPREYGAMLGSFWFIFLKRALEVVKVRRKSITRGRGADETMLLCAFVWEEEDEEAYFVFPHCPPDQRSRRTMWGETSQSEKTFAERRRGKLHKLQSSTAVIIIITLWRIILTKDANFQEVCHFCSQARGANDDMSHCPPLATCFLPLRAFVTLF